MIRFLFIVCLFLVGCTTAPNAQGTQNFNAYVNGLPSAAPPNGSEQLYVLQGGLSRKIPMVNAQSGNVFNVMSFGAKCDGVTDDTAAIQAAVTASGAVNPAPVGKKSIGTIYIPGRCAVSSTILARNRAHIPSGAAGGIVNIWCAGGASGLVWIGADNTGPMLQLGIDGQSGDGPFDLGYCAFGSATGLSANKPSAAILLGANETAIHDNDFAWVHNAIQCAVGLCLLDEIRSNSFAGCFNNCIDSGGGTQNNGSLFFQLRS